MCHPDIAGEEAAEICILLNQAYTTLTDTTERSRYNSELQQYMEALASGIAGYTVMAMCCRSLFLFPEANTRMKDVCQGTISDRLECTEFFR